jgi:hypothetical protein
LDWRVFWLKATLKHFMPLKPQLRALKRRFRPYQTIPSIDRGLFASGIRILLSLDRQAIPVRDATVVELGSGWNPVIPLLFVLCGARRVIMTDIERLMDGNLLQASLTQVLSAQEEITIRLGASAGSFDRINEGLTVLKRGEGFEAALDALGMTYMVPFGAASVPPGSIDISFSRATLEHIPPHELRMFFALFLQISRPGGVTIHETDHSDHRSHYDKSLSPVDFLRYSPAMWRIIDLRGRHNRLRCSELKAIIEDAGWQVIGVETETSEAAERAMQTLPVADAYKGYAVADLAVQSSIITGRKPGLPG